jgi:hypothetical protein
MLLRGQRRHWRPTVLALIGKADVPERLQRFDHGLGALGSSRRKPMADRPGERAVGPLIWPLTADDKGQHVFLGVFADYESEPPAAHDMPTEWARSSDSSSKTPDGVPNKYLHGIRGWVVRPVAGPQAPVVDVDPTELAGRKRLGDVRLSHIGDGVQEPAMKNDRDSVTALVLEVHLATVQPVPRAGHQGHLFCTDSRLRSPYARASAYTHGPLVEDRPTRPELDALKPCGRADRRFRDPATHRSL